MTRPAAPTAQQVRHAWSVSRFWAWVALCGIGAGFAFGPDQWHAAPSYAAVDGILTHQLHIGWRPLGAVFLLAAVLIVIPKRMPRLTGNYVGAVLYLLFTAGLVLALFRHQLQGFPALFLWTLGAAVHLDAVNDLWGRRKGT